MRPGQEEPHVVFTPSGTLLTSAQHGDTILWDARSGRVLRRYSIGGLPAVSADGREVALGRNTPSATDRELIGVAARPADRPPPDAGENLSTAWIRGIAFSPDGSRIVADAFDGMHVWDVASGTIVESFAGQPGSVRSWRWTRSVTTAFVGPQDGSVAAFDLSGARRLGRTFAWNAPADTLPGESAGPCDAVDPRSGPAGRHAERRGGGARRPPNRPPGEDAAGPRRHRRGRRRVPARRPHAGQRRHQRARHLLGSRNLETDSHAPLHRAGPADRPEPRRPAAGRPDAEHGELELARRDRAARHRQGAEDPDRPAGQRRAAVHPRRPGVDRARLLPGRVGRCVASTCRSGRVLFERSVTRSYPTRGRQSALGHDRARGREGRGPVPGSAHREGRASAPPSGQRRHLICRLLT